MQLLNAAPGSTLAFESFQGMRRCCDLGDPTLNFHADGTLLIEIHGFVLEERTTRFQIATDGQLQVLSSDASLADWLRQRDVGSAVVYRYRSDLYLAKPGAGLQLRPGKPMQWPFRAALGAP